MPVKCLVSGASLVKKLRQKLQISDSKLNIEKYQGISLTFLTLHAYKDNLKFTHTVHTSATLHKENVLQNALKIQLRSA